ncbi:helix-turn-helix domain-containing protein [Curtobacterium sp. BRB10]|uniref:TetR/AcrR family transcriptional regulator n=1 Tax=Curtobacterium sp. BRB10 TaxID=2962579 RepID=UPI002881BA24|nr:helix-turn-helix domain-containing protein [Curtobacterium sp. BRB10]MDT0234851.1 helix-turn-helix domain-containing protein [Curtobacterium sp. BRB10]
MSTSTGTRGPYRKSVERRREIVQTALDVFAERGYSSGSMREIAARAGLTQSGLLHHFASKEDLLTEVVELRDRQVDEALARHGAPPLLERMAVIAAHNRENRKLSSVFVILSAEAVAEEHPAHEYFRRRYERQHVETERAVREEQRSGRIRPDLDAGAVAAGLVALLDGFELQQELRPGFDPERAVRAFVSSLSVLPTGS